MHDIKEVICLYQEGLMAVMSPEVMKDFCTTLTCHLNKLVSKVDDLLATANKKVVMRRDHIRNGIVESDLVILNAIKQACQVNQPDFGDYTNKLAESDEKFLSKCFEILLKGDLSAHTQLSYTMQVLAFCASASRPQVIHQ